jgi:hypothetical protein
MSVNSALGAMAVVVDRIPTMTKNKLLGIKPGSDEAFYLLAAYCFNLSRKLEYFFLAAKEFGLDADRAVVQRLQRDRDELARAGSEWREIAEKEEELMRRLYDDIKNDYETLWKRLTEGGGGDR